MSPVLQYWDARDPFRGFPGGSRMLRGTNHYAGMPLAPGHPIPLRGSEPGWGTQKPANCWSIWFPVPNWGCRLLQLPAQLAAVVQGLLSPPR